MAKFVLTTCAACLARQKPVSTSANPACMKMTRTAPITTHSMLRLPATARRRDQLLGEGDAAAEQRHERRAGGPPRTYLSARFLRIGSPWFEVRGPGHPPGRSVRQLRGSAFPRQDRSVSALLRSRATSARRQRQERKSRAARRRSPASGRRSTRAMACVVELAAEPIGRARSGRRARPPTLVSRALWTTTPAAANAPASDGEHARRSRPVTVHAVCHGSGVVVELHARRPIAGSSARRSRRAPIPSASPSRRARGRTAERTRNVSTTAPSGHVATVAAAMSQPAAVSAPARWASSPSAVAAGDVDDPVVGRALRADGDAHRARARAAARRAGPGGPARRARGPARSRRAHPGAGARRRSARRPTPAPRAAGPSASDVGVARRAAPGGRGGRRRGSCSWSSRSPVASSGVLARATR